MPRRAKLSQHHQQERRGRRTPLALPCPKRSAVGRFYFGDLPRKVGQHSTGVDIGETPEISADSVPFSQGSQRCDRSKLRRNAGHRALGFAQGLRDRVSQPCFGWRWSNSRCLILGYRWRIGRWIASRMRILSGPSRRGVCTCRKSVAKRYLSFDAWQPDLVLRSNQF
jgi:hypothetical protein